MKNQVITTTFCLTLTILYFTNIQFPLNRESEWYYYFTYSLSHGSLIHLASNLICIAFIGGRIERIVNNRWQYLVLIILSATIGGITWTLTSSGDVLGSSGIAIGMLTFYTLFFPDQQVRLLFVFPVKMKAILIGLILCDMIMYSRLGASSSLAHATHLGSALFGYVWHHVIQDMERKRVRRLAKEYMKNLQRSE